VALTSDQIAVLSSDQLNALTTAELAALTSSQLINGADHRPAGHAGQHGHQRAVDRPTGLPGHRRQFGALTTDQIVATAHRAMTAA
jgi:hypothetical protein